MEIQIWGLHTKNVEREEQKKGGMLVMLMTNFVDDFIHYLDLPSELPLILFYNKEDCLKFYSKFYKRNKNAIDDLLDFREYKIKESSITLEEFIESCTYNMHLAFQTTFYQLFTQESIDFINTQIIDREITLEEIFAQFHKNVNVNILKYVL